MRQKITTTSVYSKIDTSLDPGQLENIIDELREKSDMDIADFKEMLERAYRDKVWKVGVLTFDALLFLCVCV